MLCLSYRLSCCAYVLEINQILLDELIIQIHRKPIKNIYLRIKPPEGLISISIPLKADMDWVQQFLNKKKHWIRLQLLRIRQRPQSVIEPESSLLFLGEHYPLISQSDTLSASIQQCGLHLYYSMPRDATLIEKNTCLDTWYREQFKRLIPPLIAKWEPILNVQVNAFGIRRMTTRWGSCNIRSKRISLNLNLIQKPPQCMEYVLVHEMVHLLEANHSHRFYALMDKFLPDWKKTHQLLEPNSRHHHAL